MALSFPLRSIFEGRIVHRGSLFGVNGMGTQEGVSVLVTNVILNDLVSFVCVKSRLDVEVTRLGTTVVVGKVVAGTVMTMGSKVVGRYSTRVVVATTVGVTVVRKTAVGLIVTVD